MTCGEIGEQYVIDHGDLVSRGLDWHSTQPTHPVPIHHAQERTHRSAFGSLHGFAINPLKTNLYKASKNGINGRESLEDRASSPFALPLTRHHSLAI